MAEQIYTLQLKKKDLIIVAILGEIVGVLGYAIVNAQPTLSGLFAKFLPQGLLMPLFVVGVPIAAVCALLVAYILAKKVNPIFFQMGKFAAVGFSNTAIDWGILNIILAGFGFAVGTSLYPAGKAISFAFATLNSFVWNRFWSFEKKGTSNLGKEALQFYIFTGIGLVINVIVATNIARISPESKLWAGVIAPALATATSMVWNFTAYKFFVFKKPASQKMGQAQIPQ
ncbi:MAG: hypothetical protein A3A97_04435 [Candidatus Terrybacteria bacterium RIFCSPLOWO2_01_FULL_40_23]|uniref:GtrA/DPMS transmembrane domain-containing protein n=1 Tax=Candidatus Terrybacteria bacterium RIFCSPLOWO2_01_FULL_40_23 TaxID=1802366 RepID=A0A1G2PUY7_9BACT|nr:MAG: hypothetical protein A3A97_04435 [Candidatus Terrybacteria bacterium RIFCSPLOWO2_01_FULL_40_23]